MNIRLFLASFLTCLCLLPCAAQKQHGKASYYSKRSTGARTASGQKIHHDSLTCAHRYYPFGTMLKVTNMSNNKSVNVKVIDRGPFGRGRIIDLSWAAAKEIGMLAQGVASVKVELLDNRAIPYRPEETKLPRIEFDMAESDYKFPEGWKKEKEKNDKKDVHHNKEKVEHKDNPTGTKDNKVVHTNKKKIEKS